MTWCIGLLVIALATLGGCLPNIDLIEEATEEAVAPTMSLTATPSDGSPGRVATGAGEDATPSPGRPGYPDIPTARPTDEATVPATAAQPGYPAPTFDTPTSGAPSGARTGWGQCCSLSQCQRPMVPSKSPRSMSRF